MSVLSEEEMEFLQKNRDQSADDHERTRKIQEEYLNATLNLAALAESIGQTCKFETEKLDESLTPIFDKFPEKKNEMRNIKWEYDGLITYEEFQKECDKINSRIKPAWSILDN